MSTRSTVFYDKDDSEDGWHLYHELIDDGALYLEIVQGQFLFTGKLPEKLAAIIEKGLEK